VGLHDGETIVVGGLIEDTDSRTVSKIPILGELPIIGRLFQDVGTTHTRNELVVTVTPHIIKDGFRAEVIDRDLPIVPTAPPLPSLAPDATLPPRRAPQASAIPPPTFAPAMPAGVIAAPDTPTPAPAPTPSAFAQTNVYTFGSPPPNNYASASQSPQIFYLQVKPTVIKPGQPVTVAAVTTSNVSSLTFGTSSADTSQSLGSIGAGKWQGVVTVNAIGLGTSTGNVMMFINATTSSGATVSLQVPFSLAR
jgi:Flp pilus assembly secretin CpaC